MRSVANLSVVTVPILVNYSVWNATSEHNKHKNRVMLFLDRQADTFRGITLFNPLLLTTRLLQSSVSKRFRKYGWREQ